MKSENRHSKEPSGMIALSIVTVMAFMFATTAFAVLFMGIGRARRIAIKDSSRARYAAEAALVYVMQKLWANPNYPSACCKVGCNGTTKTDTLALDTDANGTNETTVNLTVTNCGEGNEHALSAKVTY